MVYHSTPYLKGNIGGAINAHVECFPDDCWVCIRDVDTHLCLNIVGDYIEEVVKANPDYGLIGCQTNRIRSKHFLYKGKFCNNSDNAEHERRTRECWVEHGTLVTPVNHMHVVPGMFMLFPKKVWKEVGGFAENSIHFDSTFTQQVRAERYKVGKAWGIYVFHLYRWGQKDPVNYLNHLK